MTKITKRLFCIFTILALAFMFAGCELSTGGTNKERTIAKNSVNQFLSINYGETLDDHCLEPVTGNIEIVNELEEHPATEYDLANNCYSGFMGGKVSARFESSNPEVMDVKWVSSKTRTLVKEGDAITGITIAEQKKLVFMVNQPEEDTTVSITTYATAPYEVNGITYKYTGSRTIEFTVAAKAEVEAKEMTIAEINAFANADWASFQTKGIYDETGEKLTVVTHGVVTEELWGDGYDSHSFVISDGEESFYVYAPTSAVEIGDYVEVTCVPTYYYSIIETAQKAVVKVLYGGAEVPEAKAYTVDSWCAAHPDGSAFHDAPGQRLALTGTLDYSTAKGSYVMKSEETGVEMAIYYKSYNSYEESLIKQYLGMPVVLTTSIYDYHSSGYWRLLPNVYDYPIQPLTMSDEQKVAAAKSQITSANVALKYYVGDDFTLPTVNMEGVTVTWAANPTDVLVNGKFVKAADTLTFTATITCGTATDTATLTTKVAEKDVVVVTYAETTEHNPGVAYKFAVVQGNLENKVLYFNGQVSGNYLATTDDAESAADVYVEVVEGGYKLYTLDGETKKYIEAYVSGTYVNLKLADAGEVVYTYNEEYNTFVCHLLDNDKYIGAYKTYDTLSTSNLSYAATSFVAHLYKAEGGETPDENEAGMKAAMEAGLALAAGATTTEEYTFTGVVTGKVGNSFYLQAGKYGMYVYNKAIEELEVGDLVTVTATIQNYNGLVETKAISAAEIVGTGTLPTPKTIAELADIEQIMSNTLITVEGLTYKSGSITVGSSSGVFFNFGTGELQVRTDKYLDDTVEEAIKTKLESLKDGDTVNLVGIIASWNKGVAQCQFLSADSILINAPITPPVEPDENEAGMKAAMEAGLALAAGANTTEEYTFTGVVTGMVGNSFYLQAGSYGMYVYNKAIEGLKVGDKVTVTATIQNYNGLVETKAISAAEIVGTGTLPTPKKVAELADIEQKMSNTLITVEGLTYKSGSITVGSSSGVYFNFGTGELQVRTDKYLDDAVEEAIKAKLESVEDGDTVKLVGVIASWNKNNAQCQFLSADNIIITKGQGGDEPDEPTETTYEVTTEHAANTAYKLGLVQANLNKTLFFTGKMDKTYYFGTTEDPEAAVDVYVEVVEGGYKLYFLEGTTKKYIGGKISGTHNNIVFGDAESTTLFVYDETNNTFIVTLGENQLYMGTFGSNNTISLSTLDKMATSYVAHLYKAVGGETPVEPEEPEEPVETPTMTIAEVLASTSNITTEFKVSGLVTSIKTPYSSDFNNVTFFISDGTNELQIYRLTGGADIVVGDYVTIKGTYTTSYGGEIEAGCTLVEKAPYKTIAEVLASTENITTPIVVSGVVSSIKSAYSEQFNNVTFFISDGENELQIYRLTGGAEIAVGDTVYVKGTYTTSYGGEIEAKCELLMRTPAPEELDEDLTKVATFSFGANGDAAHVDGKENNKYTESNGGYTLTLADSSKVYAGAFDAKGNSCLKLGTGSAASTLSFTVADDVKQVIIYVAGYKANKANISINSGATQSISSQSNNGDYVAIIIDTTTNKTVTLETLSGGYRCMIDTIEFYK